MGVVATARGRRAAAFAARLARSARRLLRGLRLADAELSLVVVSDRKMRALNRRYRGVDRPTDVLSFSLREGAGPPPDGLLGDVVISLETARRQAAVRGERLLIHGLLHLLGYDHERSAADADRMARRARTLERWLR